MIFRELKNLIGSSGDAILALDGDGALVAMNSAAEEMLGFSEADAVGRHCNNLLCGVDESGRSCAPNCAIKCAATARRQIRNYDLQVLTRHGVKWCNISVLTAEVSSSVFPYTIHILRPNDTQKRLELAMSDFVAGESRRGTNGPAHPWHPTRLPVREAVLSEREKEILQLLAAGSGTGQISSKLCISRTTVGNHIQHILKKLGAHSRLEAIRMAEYAGLI